MTIHDADVPNEAKNNLILNLGTIRSVLSKFELNMVSGLGEGQNISMDDKSLSKNKRNKSFSKAITVKNKTRSLMVPFFWTTSFSEITRWNELF